MKKRVNRSETVEAWTDEKGFEKIEVYESIFTMDKVLEPLAFCEIYNEIPKQKEVTDYDCNYLYEYGA